MFIFTYHLKGILQNQFNKMLVKRLVGIIPTQKVYFVFRYKKRHKNSNARICVIITIIYIYYCIIKTGACN